MDDFVTDIGEQLHSPFLADIERVAKGSNLINQVEWEISDFSLLLFMYTVLTSNKPLGFGTNLCYFNYLKMETKLGSFVFICKLVTSHQTSSIFRFYTGKILFYYIVSDGISIK